MPVSNPSAVKFCNEKIRVAADRLSQDYYFAKQVCDEWEATNMVAFLKGTETVEDGSSTDGRHPITCDEAAEIVSHLEDFVSDYESADKEKLHSVLKVSVSPFR